MLDPALQNALIRQAEISAALAKMSADLAEVNAFIQSYYRMSALGTAPNNSSAPPIAEPIMASPRPAPAKVKIIASKHEVLESIKVARVLIGSQNRPLRVQDLYTEARARGFGINTDRPHDTYRARLRDRKDRIGLIYLKGFGWWLKELPYPPAGYRPSTASGPGAHVN